MGLFNTTKDEKDEMRKLIINANPLLRISGRGAISLKEPEEVITEDISDDFDSDQ